MSAKKAWILSFTLCYCENTDRTLVQRRSGAGCTYHLTLNTFVLSVDYAHMSSAFNINSCFILQRNDVSKALCKRVSVDKLYIQFGSRLSP